MRHPATRLLFLSLGWLSLAVGVIGIFLPLLPTTPFLIVAAFCFNRGSPHFHAWLLNHRYFGPPVRDWQDRRAIATHYKALATLMMSGTGLYLVLAERVPIGAKAAYLAVALAVLAFIWTRPSR